MKMLWKTAAAWLGTLLGLTSCSKIIGNSACMYATPYADYDFDIIVMDENRNPIPGIRAGIEDEPVTSDASGRIKATVLKASFPYVELTDVDGQTNGGEFDAKTVSLSDLDVKRTKKGKGWYSGRYSVSGEVQLTKKQAEGQE